MVEEKLEVENRDSNWKDNIGYVIIAALILSLFWAVPRWNVWRSGLTGEAELARAEQNRQIMVETARAELESAKLRAQAIGIIGEAAKKYPEYRHQEFIGAFAETLREGNIQQIIYVPTEGNIPILEAGKRVLPSS